MGSITATSTVLDSSCCDWRACDGLAIPGLAVQENVPFPVRDSWSYGPKLIVIMVGLPARGKSYISKKLARYLNWLQYETKVFNAGQVRRQATPSETSCKPTDTGLSHPASFFNPDNQSAVAVREEIAMKTLDELLIWLKQPRSCVGILDATNGTINRRRNAIGRIRAVTGSMTEVLFLESKCTDPELLEKNINLKLSGPDYFDREQSAALADFRQRIRQYEKKFVSMGTYAEEENMPYLQLTNLGRRAVANCITGFLSAQSVEYLLNLRLHNRQIWITRNGESLDDQNGIIGRSKPLSSRGARFASALRTFIDAQRQLWELNRDQTSLQGAHAAKTHQLHPSIGLHARSSLPRFHVWTSMMQQAIETSHYFRHPAYIRKSLRMLNDLHAGNLEGMTFAQIEARNAHEMAARREDPVYYRWPGTGGESYADVIHRLRPVILELERISEHILLITHRAVARVLLAYFTELQWQDIAEVDVPPGRVFSVRPMPYGVEVESWQYDEHADDFYRVKT